MSDGQRMRLFLKVSFFLCNNYYISCCSLQGTAGMETSLQDRDRVGVQDAVLLEDYTSEAAFVDNLQKRFKENIIYVSIYNLKYM